MLKNEKRRFSAPTVLAVAAAAALAGMLAMNQNQQQQIEDRIQPIVEIIGFGESAISGLGRFDTSTGEIKRFMGDPRNPSSAAVWAPAVPGVGNEAPGTFRIQRPEPVRPGVFLVNVTTGDTWILDERRDNAFSWRQVRDLN